ncbi:Gldg family protein [Halpernia sp. GG3]
MLEILNTRVLSGLIFPLGIAENNNPITKNINPVKFEFPTSIDTLGRKNIKINVLFESSDRTLLKSVPNYVSLNEIVKADSFKSGRTINHAKNLCD